MRKTKRFTEQVIRRFENSGRGLGISVEYAPWHQVSRSDPSSRGRSHWHLSALGRHHHLLSDLERCCLLFILSLPGLRDCLEQFPTPIADEVHVLVRYGHASPLRTYPGTERIASALNIRHPRVTRKRDGKLWQMTTDFLVIRQGSLEGRPTPLAISVKPDAPLTKRQRELLSIEKEYWNGCGVQWLLFTPALFHAQVRLNLEQIACWLVPALPIDLVSRTAEAVLAEPNRSLTQVLATLSSENGDLNSTQRLFWQAVYFGLIPVDLRIPIRPTRPLPLISPNEFRDLNPVAAGRSAWI